MSVQDRFIPALRFQALTRYYDPVVRLTTREATVKRVLVEHVGVPDGGTVLDIGCGTGTLTIWLRQAYPASRVLGLDADAEILSLARDKAAKSGSDVRFVEANATQLPFDDESVDRVVSSLFFHHLKPSYKQRTLAEIRRVLKNGGELHFSDWGKPGNSLMRWLFLPVQLLDGFENTHDHAAGRLPQLFREAGFSQVVEHADFNTVFGTLRLVGAVK